MSPTERRSRARARAAMIVALRKLCTVRSHLHKYPKSCHPFSWLDEAVETLRSLRTWEGI